MKKILFYITEWLWNGKDGYDPYIAYEGYSEKEARLIFTNIIPNIDKPLIELIRQDPNEDIRLDYKEE
jgi:hypothetical protein